MGHIGVLKQSGLIGDRQEDQVVRLRVPGGRDLWVFYGELERGVRCLRCLQTNGKVRPAQDVELIGWADWVYLVSVHVGHSST